MRRGGLSNFKGKGWVGNFGWRGGKGAGVTYFLSTPESGSSKSFDVFVDMRIKGRGEEGRGRGGELCAAVVVVEGCSHFCVLKLGKLIEFSQQRKSPPQRPRKIKSKFSHFQSLYSSIAGTGCIMINRAS